MSPRARARGVAVALALAGALVAPRAPMLLAGWTLALIPSLAGAGLLKRHLQFVAWVLVPFAMANILAWGVVVAAPPGVAPGSDPAGGLAYAATAALRLAVIGGVIQLGFLSIPPAEFPTILYRWGVRGHALVVCLGGFAVIPELRRRAGHVLSARLARGLTPKRSWLRGATQLPRTLRVLLTWTLRTAVDRAESWQQKSLPQRVGRLAGRVESGAGLGSVLWPAVSAVWLAWAVIGRVGGGAWP